MEATTLLRAAFTSRSIASEGMTTLGASIHETGRRWKIKSVRSRTLLNIATVVNVRSSTGSQV